MRMLLAIAFTFSSLVCEAKIDTIRINLDHQTGNFFPSRCCAHSSSKVGPKTFSYIDSIRIGIHEIRKGGQRYYLMVYDMKGVKRLEGEFFDEFADGKVILFDATGRKAGEGHYKMTEYNRPRTMCRSRGKRLRKNFYTVQTGTWKYYDRKGTVIREEKY